MVLKITLVNYTVHISCNILLFFFSFFFLFFFFTSAFTGWETSNKYSVNNAMGQQVYYAAEGKLSPVWQSDILRVMQCPVCLYTNNYNHKHSLTITLMLSVFI